MFWGNFFYFVNNWWISVSVEWDAQGRWANYCVNRYCWMERTSNIASIRVKCLHFFLSLRLIHMRRERTSIRWRAYVKLVNYGDSKYQHIWFVHIRSERRTVICVYNNNEQGSSCFSGHSSCPPRVNTEQNTITTALACRSECDHNVWLFMCGKIFKSGTQMYYTLDRRMRGSTGPHKRFVFVCVSSWLENFDEIHFSYTQYLWQMIRLNKIFIPVRIDDPELLSISLAVFHTRTDCLFEPLEICFIDANCLIVAI